MFLNTSQWLFILYILFSPLIHRVHPISLVLTMCVPMSMPNSVDTARLPQQQSDLEALGRPSRLLRPTSDTQISEVLSPHYHVLLFGLCCSVSGSIKRTLFLHYPTKDTHAYTDDSAVRKTGFCPRVCVSASHMVEDREHHGWREPRSEACIECRRISRLHQSLVDLNDFV